MGLRIFKDDAHQKLFDKQGFLVLPFLTSEEVKELDAFFDELHPNVGENGFFSGSYSNDFKYKKKASDKIVEVFSRAYEATFVDYTPFGGAFLYKTPGLQSELAVHQDWTIVNEETDVALNCWIPLCDVTKENGALQILPGSHYKKHPVLRAPTLPFFFSGNDDVVIRELETMEVKAGTAVILNQSVIHHSPPNNSNAIRKAITAGVKSKGAQMHFHYKVSDKDEVEIFKEEDDFLIRFDNFMEDIGQRPKLGESVGFKPYKLPQYSREELKQLIHKMKIEAGFQSKNKIEPIVKSQNIGLFQRIKNLIGA
jgi:hypothetical protein